MISKEQQQLYLYQLYHNADLMGTLDGDYREAIKFALEHLLSSPPKPRIRKLKWKQGKYNMKEYYAIGFGTQWYITQLGNDFWLNQKKYPNLKEAQQAAQKDFEAMVRDCFEQNGEVQ